jgi:hypothetical protein
MATEAKVHHDAAIHDNVANGEEKVITPTSSKPDVENQHLHDDADKVREECSFVPNCLSMRPLCHIAICSSQNGSQS